MHFSCIVHCRLEKHILLHVHQILVIVVPIQIVLLKKLPVLIYYYLVSPFVSDFEEPFNTTTNEFALGVGEAFVISWNLTDMTEGLVSVNDITVSIAMVSVS